MTDKLDQAGVVIPHSNAVLANRIAELERENSRLNAEIYKLNEVKDRQAEQLVNLVNGRCKADIKAAVDAVWPSAEAYIGKVAIDRAIQATMVPAHDGGGICRVDDLYQFAENLLQSAQQSKG